MNPTNLGWNTSQSGFVTDTFSEAFSRELPIQLCLDLDFSQCPATTSTTQSRLRFNEDVICLIAAVDFLLWQRMHFPEELKQLSQGVHCGRA